MIEMRLRTRYRSVVITILINIAVWMLAVLWILPFYGIFVVSVLPYRSVIVEGWLRLLNPLDLTFANYLKVLTDATYDLGTGLRNSFIVASLSTFIPVFAAALAAYAFTQFDFRLKALLFTLVLFIMMVPQQLCIVPLYFLYFETGLYNTHLGLILLHSAWGIAWSTFLLRNYFRLLPSSLTEAARVFGAKDWTIFSRIILPLSKPALITALIMQFTWVWNDLFYALVFLVDKNLQVATQKVIAIKGEYVVDWSLLSAGSIITMIVPLIIYIVFNKYYIRGVAGWGVKR
ncbi:MAG: carbohydrate ABC transporter permease [Desulfurococcaceae archaeon]